MNLYPLDAREMRLVCGLVPVLFFLLVLIQFLNFTLKNAERTTQRAGGVGKTFSSEQNHDYKDQEQPMGWFA